MQRYEKTVPISITDIYHLFINFCKFSDLFGEIIIPLTLIAVEYCFESKVLGLHSKGVHIP